MKDKEAWEILGMRPNWIEAKPEKPGKTKKTDEDEAQGEKRPWSWKCIYDLCERAKDIVQNPKTLSAVNATRYAGGIDATNIFAPDSGANETIACVDNPETEIKKIMKRLPAQIELFE